VSGCAPISPDGSCFDNATGSVTYSCAAGQACNITCTDSGWPTSGFCGKPQP
jgi:hypothetical protein